MSSMLAKQLGVRQVMTLISQAAYVDLVQGGPIDIAISPQNATTSAILAHIRHADVRGPQHAPRRPKRWRPCHGDARSSKVVGRKIDDIKLPEGVTIGAIVRRDEVLIAHDDVVVEAEDHVILFLVDKQRSLPSSACSK